MSQLLRLASGAGGLLAGAGQGLVGPPIGGGSGRVTALALNYLDLPNQNLLTGGDGVKVIGGHNHYAYSTATATTMDILNGTGLRVIPASGTPGVFLRVDELAGFRPLGRWWAHFDLAATFPPAAGRILVGYLGTGNQVADTHFGAAQQCGVSGMRLRVSNEANSHENEFFSAAEVAFETQQCEIFACVAMKVIVREDGWGGSTPPEWDDAQAGAVVVANIASDAGFATDTDLPVEPPISVAPSNLWMFVDGATSLTVRRVVIEFEEAA